MPELRDLVAQRVQRHRPDNQPAFEVLLRRRHGRRARRVTAAAVLAGVAALVVAVIASGVHLLPRDHDRARLAPYAGGTVLFQLHGRDCGRVERDRDWREHLEPSDVQVRCIRQSFKSGTDAYLTTRAYGTEGDPVRVLYQVVGRRRVDWIYDATQDVMADREIIRRRCRLLKPIGDGTTQEVIAARHCRRPAGGERLFRFLEPGETWCGDVELDLGDLDASPAAGKVRCLLDAFDSGHKAVLVVGFRTDADKTIRAFYKIVGKRRVEIFYDTTDAASGPRAITERECRSLTAGEPVLDHGSCRPPAG